MLNKTIIEVVASEDAKIITVQNGFMLAFKCWCNVGYGDKSEFINFDLVKFCKVSPDGLAKLIVKGKTVIIDGLIKPKTTEKDGKKYFSLQLLAESITLPYVGKQTTTETPTTTTNDEQAEYKSAEPASDDLPF
jgi:hypothetical protein